MDINNVITQLEDRKREIDITILTLRKELGNSAVKPKRNTDSRIVTHRKPMTAARKKALSLKLKKIWAARRAKAA